VFARKLQMHLDLTLRADHRETRMENAAAPYDLVGGRGTGHVCGRGHAEGHSRITRAEPGPKAGKSIVRVEDENTIRGETTDDLCLGTRHALDTAEALKMRPARVIEHRDIRADQPAQIVDLARMVRTHLDDRVMLVPQTAQGQRNTDLIVEIAARSQHASSTRQNSRRHLFQGGLAIAAGNADHARRALQTPLLTEATETQQGICDLHQWHIGAVNMLDHCTRCTTFTRSLKIIVAVKVRATQRNEQLPGTQGAGIRAHSIELAVGTQHTAIHHGREFRKTEDTHAAPPAITACTRSISLKDSRRPATSW
jgi:hypothetical protein